MELYQKYRPTKISELCGQDSARASLLSLVKKNRIPHAMLFTGPSGVGKTTLARILKTKLGCVDRNYQEINAANFRGIDMVRDLTDGLYLAPLGGRTRVAVVDEAHQLTKDAQNAFLKVLEDPPRHAHIFLCTTDPQKLLKTIITRCTEIRLESLTGDQIEQILDRVCEKEEISIGGKVKEELCTACEGSARKVLVLLDQIRDLPEDEQIEAIQKSDTKRQAIDLCRLLFRNARWAEVASAIKGISDEPETVRRIILGYASAVCLGGGKMAPKAALVLNSFRDHFYDCGKAGLVLACFDCSHSRD